MKPIGWPSRSAKSTPGSGWATICVPWIRTTFACEKVLSHSVASRSPVGGVPPRQICPPAAGLSSTTPTAAAVAGCACRSDAGRTGAHNQHLESLMRCHRCESPCRAGRWFGNCEDAGRRSSRSTRSRSPCRTTARGGSRDRLPRCVDIRQGQGRGSHASGRNFDRAAVHVNCECIRHTVPFPSACSRVRGANRWENGGLRTDSKP